jgi:hypothetical protein
MALRHPALARFELKVGRRVGATKRALALDLFARLSKATPVRTGVARAGWHLTKNEIDPSYPAPRRGQVGRRDAQGRFLAGGGRLPPPRIGALGAVNVGDILWITNNVPYILDLNDGTSDQAPKNFVQMAIAETETFYENLVHKVIMEDGGL